MNLYMLSRTNTVDYDEFDRAIVAAETEDAARLVHPNGYAEWAPAQNAWIGRRPDGSTWEASPTWIAPADVQVLHIGTALPGQKAGVVLASFNAG